MKTAEEILEPYIETPFRHTKVVEKDNALLAMGKFADQFSGIVWIKPEDSLPPKKEGWEHSEQVLLHYPSTEFDIETYGIGYYHYNPPFRKPGFIDFSISRTPDLWSVIEKPLKK